MTLTGQSLSEIQSDLIRGDLVCETLVRTYLQAIEANKDLFGLFSNKRNLTLTLLLVGQGKGQLTLQLLH